MPEFPLLLDFRGSRQYLFFGFLYMLISVKNKVCNKYLIKIVSNLLINVVILALGKRLSIRY